MYKYENIVKDICNTTWDRLHVAKKKAQTEGDEWEEVEINQEIDGWNGVSCVIAYMKGVEPTLSSMAKHFDVHEMVVISAMSRLEHNGVFSKRYDLMGDKALQGNVCNPATTRLAWCHLAGLSSGFCKIII